MGGDGYSGIAAESGVLYSMYRSGSDEVVIAVSATDGKTLWEHRYTADFRNPDPKSIALGPHAMPQVVGGRVFTAGVSGIVHALDKKTGKVIWTHDLWREFGGTRVDWGYSCHGLPFRDTIIYLSGGRGKAVISFRQADGSAVWARHSFQNAHSSPLLINVGGLDQVVFVHADEIFSVNPINGDAQWAHPHKTDWGLAIATPVWNGGDLLFISSAYDTGARVVELTRAGNAVSAKEVWSERKLQIHFGTIVSQGAHLIASSGSRTALMTMFEWRTGKIAWQTRDFVKAHVVSSGNKLIIVDADGTVGLATATPQGLTVHTKAAVLTSTAWTPPTLAGTTLFVRDRQNLIALDLAG
jgi:outer membrane protein assembly factor BamB